MMYKNLIGLRKVCDDIYFPRNMAELDILLINKMVPKIFVIDHRAKWCSRVPGREAWLLL